MNAYERIRRFIKLHSLLIVFAIASLTVLSMSFYTRAVVNYFVNASEQNVRDKLRAASIVLATMAGAEELNSYREPADVELPKYRALRQRLVDFAKETNVLYAYYLRVEGDKVQYIIDNDLNEKTRVGIDTPPEDLSEYQELLPALDGKVHVSKLGVYVDGWDGLISGYVPVFDNHGNVAAVAGVDINDKEMVDMHKLERLLWVLELASVTIVFGCGTYGFLKYRREARNARSASSAKSRFLSRMSHEIRTPMNAILGMSDLALMNYGRQQGLEYISNIKQAGTNLLAIINGILDLTAIESGRLVIMSEPYEVTHVLSDVLAIAKMRLKDKSKENVKLTVDVAPDIPNTISGDETRVREIIMNLLSNAIKYTKYGFIRFAVRSEHEDPENIVLTFEVSDSGIGIKREDMDRLFVDFFRVENNYTSSIQGTGLGLSITRMLCRAMGGDVGVSSEYGLGSTFTAKIRQRIVAGRTIGAFENIEGSGDKPNMLNFVAPDFRVLAVDDIEANLKVIKGLLAPYRMKTDTCLSGAEAVTLVQSNDYDLVLMDHMMPEMDGFETVTAIRALGGCFEKLPIAVCTANVILGMKDIFLKSGFDDYLPKPIEIPKLNELVERWVPHNKRIPFNRKLTNERRVLADRRFLRERRFLPDRRAVSSKLRNADTSPKHKLFKNRITIIGDLDVEKGMAISGGSPAAYKDLLKIYCKDVDARIGFFNVAYAESDIKAFITHVHGLKSASASIGATALSNEAYTLENAGRRNDTAFIRDHVNGFHDRLASMKERIVAVLASDEKPTPRAGNGDATKTQLDGSVISALKNLKKALETEDVGAIDRLLAELSAMQPTDEIADLLSSVSEMVLTCDFNEAVKNIDAVMNGAGDLP